MLMVRGETGECVDPSTPSERLRLRNNVDYGVVSELLLSYVQVVGKYYTHLLDLLLVDGTGSSKSVSKLLRPSRSILHCVRV